MRDRGGVVIALLAATSRITTTWSLSAFSVLIYYAIANLAALRQPREERRFPRIVPILGSHRVRRLPRL